MTPASLIRLEAELEYGVALRGDKIPVTPDHTAEVPKVTVARHASGYVVLFREGLSPDVQARFAELDESQLWELDVESDVARAIGVSRVVHCCWYCIDRVPDSSEFPDVVMRGEHFIVERDAKIAAQAWSAQVDDRASEVEVETAESYRRRGFGRQTVAAWVYHVRREGKIALYSHLLSNDASRALAASLGAEKYAETREYF